MESGELFGYLASLLVFGTFYMRRMIPLRVTAITSNLAFIAYASFEHLMPILVLHSALLPLNVYRLIEHYRLTTRARTACTDPCSFGALKQIDRLAKSEGIGRSEAIRRLVELGLKAKEGSRT